VQKGEIIMKNRRITFIPWVFAVTLMSIPVATAVMGGEAKESELHLVSGILLKLDLENNRGLLTTDLGRPIYFDVPKAYLFENVTVGARISLRLDEEGRALKVMDTSIPDVIVTPNVHSVVQPLATSVEEPMSQ
jgi:hypothetical protein